MKALKITRSVTNVLDDVILAFQSELNLDHIQDSQRDKEDVTAAR